MVGLVSALQVEEEVRGREEQLNTLLKNKKTMKVHAYTYLHVHYNIFNGHGIRASSRL